jgi:hypothetical protein
VKTRIKIAIAAGAVLASALAAVPAQAHAVAPAKAAAPALVGVCGETFFCAWDASGYLFWSTNAPNRTFYIEQDVSDVANLTGYDEEVLADTPTGWQYVPIKPHTGPTYLGEYVELIETS